MAEEKKQFEVGDFVWAYMKPYPWWPAKVILLLFYFIILDCQHSS